MADGRKLDSNFRVEDSTCVLLPIHRLYTRVQAPTWALFHFHPAASDLQQCLELRDFLGSAASQKLAG